MKVCECACVTRTHALWGQVFETTHSYRSELRSLQLLLTLVPSSVILEVTGQSVNMLRYSPCEGVVSMGVHVKVFTM